MYIMHISQVSVGPVPACTKCAYVKLFLYGGKWLSILCSRGCISGHGDSLWAIKDNMKVLYITCLHCTQDMAVCIVCLTLLIMYVYIAVECIISAYRIIIHTNTYEAEKGQDQLQLSGYTFFGNCSQI